MREIEIILSLSATCLGLIITILTFIIKLTKSAKVKRKCERILQISNALIPYIEEAEKLKAYSGKEKKEYVITKANQYAIDNKIPFHMDEVSEKIEDLVKLTKKVNAKEEEIMRPWLTQ